jgi:hypothetical protein
MSIDAQIAHACPHHIRYETVSILGGREIIPLSPIAGVSLLELRKDGISIPSEGLKASATVVFPNSSPYRINSTSNALIVEGAGLTKTTITLPSKIINQAEMVAVLNKNLPSPLKATVYQKSIQITDNLLSDGFKLSGASLSKLGFSSTTLRAKSKELFPSWKLVRQKNFVGYKILLSKPYFNEGEFDLSYGVEKSYCRRCAGTGVENDLRFDSVGDLTTIKDYDLLYQRVAKALLTQRGSNPYHIFYGSTATSLIGQKVSAGVVQSLKSSVRKALNDLIDVQTQQSKIQPMSLEERVRRVRGVEVSTIGDDETSYLVRVTVESFSSKPVSINIIFAVPGSIPLDGDLT